YYHSYCLRFSLYNYLLLVAMRKYWNHQVISWHSHYYFTFDCSRLSHTLISAAIQEDDRLIELYSSLGPAWRLISRCMKTRTARQCSERCLDNMILILSVFKYF